MNRSVTASGQARKLCKALDGHSMLVVIRDTPLAFRFTVVDEALRLSMRSDESADVTISGPPASLARVAASGGNDAGARGAVELTGDPALMRDFQQLLALATPDWEEELSRVVGDVAAHQIGNLVRSMVGWGREAAATLGRDATEYLQEENRTLPTRYEIEEFLDAVDRVRADLDRAEARLAALEASPRFARRTR